MTHISSAIWRGKSHLISPLKFCWRIVKSRAQLNDLVQLHEYYRHKLDTVNQVGKYIYCIYSYTILHSFAYIFFNLHAYMIQQSDIHKYKSIYKIFVITYIWYHSSIVYHIFEYIQMQKKSLWNDAAPGGVVSRQVLRLRFRTGVPGLDPWSSVAEAMIIISRSIYFLHLPNARGVPISTHVRLPKVTESC